MDDDLKKLCFVLLLIFGWQTAVAMYSEPNMNLLDAISHNNLEAAAAAIKAGADVNLPDKFWFGCTPLDTACLRDDCCIPLIKLLLEKGANPNTARHVMYYCACSENRVELASLLLQYGANPDETGGDDGGTGLYEVAKMGYEDIARILIQYGARVNYKDLNGWTPLHVAANWGSFDVARLLLDYGADCMLRTNEIADELAKWATGKTPLEIVQCKKKKNQDDLQVMQLLEEWPRLRAQKRLALFMASHPRVGASSSLMVLNPYLLRHIAEYIYPLAT